MRNFVRIALGFLIATTVLPAANISFTGALTAADQVQVFTFTVSGAVISIQSWGYGGGTNAAAASIPSGGIDTLFAIFDGTGTFVAGDDDGCGNCHLKSGNKLDSFYNNGGTALQPGTYTLALTQSTNLHNGDFSDGFTYSPVNQTTCLTAFCDGFGGSTNGSWAVDFLSVDSATEVTGAPEPISFSLAGCGIVLIALARKRRGFFASAAAVEIGGENR